MSYFGGAIIPGMRANFVIAKGVIIRERHKHARKRVIIDVGDFFVTCRGIASNRKTTISKENLKNYVVTGTMDVGR
jgi:hypothetical protein